MPFFESTAFETEILRQRLARGEDPGGVVHRIEITSTDHGALVTETTNDDDDDGIADGDWTTWQHHTTHEIALNHAGKCRVGLSGVIVTVIFDGKEVR
jgi:hypothetical protein